MKKLLKQFNEILTKSERKKFVYFAILNSIIAVLQLFSVFSIFPFMKLASDPNSFINNELFQKIISFFQLNSNKEIIVFGGIVVISFLVISNLLTLFSEWQKIKFTWAVFSSIENRLLHTYLNQPYSFFVQNNTSKVITNLTSEIMRFTNGFLLNSVTIISKTLLILLVSILLFVTNPKTTLIIFISLSGIYALIYFSMVKQLSDLGKSIQASNKRRFYNITESFNGIKTLKLYNLENRYLSNFRTASEEYSVIPPKIKLLQLFPKYILEIFAFGAIVLVIVFKASSKSDLTKIIPVLSLYALAGYKLIPAFQMFFSALTNIKHFTPNVELLSGELARPILEKNNSQSKNYISFTKEIFCREISFTHIDATTPTLNKLNIKIPKGSTVALIGSTGSGKTTFLDIISGLTKPDSGEILIDGTQKKLYHSLDWQKIISYVPQSIFLYDTTIKDNICLEAQSINEEMLIRCTKLANIHDFIVNELPNGYDSKIGENGVRLSGGQKQRLGLARALYRNPQLLILDESTNALDKVTEQKILSNLKKFDSELTILIISHTMSAVKHADKIYLLKNGAIDNCGTYEELRSASEDFKILSDLS